MTNLYLHSYDANFRNQDDVQLETSSERLASYQAMGSITEQSSRSHCGDGLVPCAEAHLRALVTVRNSIACTATEKGGNALFFGLDCFRHAFAVRSLQRALWFGVSYKCFDFRTKDFESPLATVSAASLPRRNSSPIAVETPLGFDLRAQSENTSQAKASGDSPAF